MELYLQKTIHIADIYGHVINYDRRMVLNSDGQRTGVGFLVDAYLTGGLTYQV